MPKTGRPRAERVARACEGCGKHFLAPPHDIRRGRGRFCTNACYQANKGGRKRGFYKGHEPEEKACIACGKMFMVGGRDNPKRSQGLCSMECQRQSRHRKPRVMCKPMTDTQSAYLAGILDGEGAVMLVSRRNSAGAHLMVYVCNTHLGVLEWVAATTGMGRICKVDRSKHATAKDCYHWRVSGDTAESLLRKLLPFLIIKKDRAEIGVRFQERLKVPALAFDKAWQLEWMSEMKLLNKRGRPDTTPPATYVATYPAGG